MKYRPEIDGLRAIAVLAVIIFHAGFTLLPGGFLGVDIFFVISGYLITAIITQERQAGTFSFRGFYARRARRILPALYLVILTCLPVGFYVLIREDMLDLVYSALWTTLFVPNFYFWDTADYFSRSAEFKPLIHTWSLGVEEQFYLLFPLLMVFLAARTRSTAIAATGALSFALAIFFQPHDPDAVFYLLPFRAWELTAGALVAMGETRVLTAVRSSAARGLLGAGGLGLIIAALTLPAQFLPTILSQAVAVAGAALGLLFWRSGTLPARLMGSAPLVVIGLMSYSAYLWHQPVLAFARSLDGLPPGPGFTAFLLAVIFALSFLSWHFVEKPFRRPSSVRTSPFIATLVSVFLLINALAVGYMLMARAPDAFLSPLQKQVDQTAQASPLRERCHVRQGDSRSPAEACVFNAKPARVAVLGNSHGVELAYALGEALRADDVGVAQFTYSACPPLYGRTDPDRAACSRWTSETVDHLAQDADVEAVVLAYSMTSLAPEIADDGQNEPAKREAALQSLFDTIDRLVAAGKRVVVVLQAPRLPRHIQYYIRDLKQPRDLDFIAAMDRPGWAAKLAALQQELAARYASKAGMVLVVDPASLFCPAQSCAAIMNGKALFFDEHHMSVSGAALVADEIVRRLKAD